MPVLIRPIVPMRVVALGIVLLSIATGSALGEQCGVCHPQERVVHEGSAHAQEGLGCTSCHGGSADAMEVDAAHRDLRSLRARAEIPAFCAECHSDLNRMRPYNLPVDQHVFYMTSSHGRGLAAGEERVAVCTDCHGVHDILGAADPRSAVYPRRLPLTCGRCHGDVELMAEFGLDAAVGEEYRTSVHGVALFDEGNLAAPNCTDCHGVHGAAPPGLGDIEKVCGACHALTRRAFLDGPHLEAMQGAGVAECAACHSNHAIRQPAISEIGPICAECHGEGSPQVALGVELRTMIDRAQEQIDAAQVLVSQAEGVPLHVEDQVARLEEAQTYITEALPLVHTVSREPVDQFTRRARAIGEEVQHELYPQLDRRSSRLGLVAFWFYLLMTLAILFNYKRRVSREPSDS